MDDPFRPPLPAPAEVPKRSPYTWSFPLSLTIHLFVLTFLGSLVFRMHGCVLIPIDMVQTGPTGNDGENGQSGSGGTAVEVALEGEQRDRLGGGTPPAPESPPNPTPDPTATPQQQSQPDPSQTQAQPRERQPEPQQRSARSNEPRVHTGTPSEQEPAEAPPPAPAEPRGTASNEHGTNPPESHANEGSPGAPGGGTGEFLRNSGLRPGSVGQQRAILPRAVHCDDEVAGIWRAQKYDPLYGDWMLATLFVHRGASNEVHGTMVVHQWDGGPFSIRPPACGPYGFDFIIDEPADGFANGRHVDFGAHSWRLREFRCNGGLRALDYHPDHFTGTIDPAREEFQSVNNDGGRAVNDPMVFRRIGCVDQAGSAGGNNSIGTGASGSDSNGAPTGNSGAGGATPALDQNHPPTGDPR